MKIYLENFGLLKRLLRSAWRRIKGGPKPPPRRSVVYKVELERMTAHCPKNDWLGNSVPRLAPVRVHRKAILDTRRNSPE